MLEARHANPADLDASKDQVGEPDNAGDDQIQDDEDDEIRKILDHPGVDAAQRVEEVAEERFADATGGRDDQKEELKPDETHEQTRRQANPPGGSDHDPDRVVLGEQLLPLPPDTAEAIPLPAVDLRVEPPEEDSDRPEQNEQHGDGDAPPDEEAQPLEGDPLVQEPNDDLSKPGRG